MSDEKHEQAERHLRDRLNEKYPDALAAALADERAWWESVREDHAEHLMILREGSLRRLAQSSTDTLEAVKAAAWDEGFDAGERDVHQHETFDEPCIPNPYRAASIEGEKS